MTSKPAIIAVMGPTGSGKTNFINRLMGRGEDGAAHGLKSHTQAVREHIVNLSNNQQYVLVDTPGFDDTYRSDRDILKTIADWLERKYRNDVKLTGIIYTHRITDNRMSGSVCKNLDMFGGLCGDTAAERVRLVTTMWDKAKDKNIAENRVSQLETNFWKPLIDAGARHERFNNSSGSAWKIVRGLTGGGEAVLLQEELVDVEMKLNETTAGKALYLQFQRLLHEQKETIKQLQEEAKAQKDSELMKQLQAEQRRLEAQLQMMLGNVDELKIPFARRAALLFTKRTQALPREIKLNLVGKLEIAENDFVIFVIGPTGAGKSWFTGKLFKNHDFQVASTSPRRLGTNSKKVKAVRCNVSAGLDNIVVVDMPSFHTDRNNFDAESMVTKWLKSTFIKKCRPGIIFLHSLDSDLPHDGMLMSRHLETFAKAFPNKFAVPSHVYVVPTSKPASTLPSETLSQRLSQLETIVGGLNGNGNHRWHSSMFPGIFKGQPEIAWSAVLLLFKGIAETEAKEFPAFPKPTLKRTPPNFLPGYIILRDVADFLFEEFRKEGTSGDLDAMITLGRTALEFIPSEHPRRHSILINLADLLYKRFQKEDTAVDLDEIITLRQAASDLMPPDDTETLAVLLELDNCFYQRFGRKNALVDLEDIISLRRVVLEYTPPQNRCKPLLSLADSLYETYQALGSVNDIEEALSLVRTASQLNPPGHPDFALSQEHLARYLKAKVRKGAALAHVRGVEAGPSSSSSSDVEQLIDKAVSEYLENIPLRLLHTPTGFLCNRDAQLSKFKDSPQYKQILLSASSLNRLQLQTEINNVVTNFFRIAMLSHRWGSGEPLLRNVDGKNIYNLGCTGGLAKLQSFCVHALKYNLQWAWSDTCCIDKDSSAELQEAIGSMFSWYRRSSLTLVHLFDISDAGSLVDSVWFKRGWTLQELLASQTILFYTRGWSLYMNCDVGDHKADPAVLGELQKATGIAEKHLRDFSPGTDDARSRLHWASGRSTTRVEDVAYSLLGIFDIHLPILYGESAEYALGRLLAEIISRSGDVSVLDWVGKASSFNSCFPANLVPYQTVPHIQLIPSDPARRDNLDLEKAHKLYSSLARLPRAGVVNRRLTLPSAVHQVTAVKLRSPSISPSCYPYEIHASHLLPLEVTLSVTLDEGVDRYILVRPWHLQELPTQTGSDDDAVWELLEQLKQPFNALLLKRLLHNEYRRIAGDCAITACVQDLAGVLDSEVLVLGIV